MATITGLTAARMLAIEGASVIDGNVVGGNLILVKHDGSQINAGNVVGPTGATGPVGPAGFSSIPGEIRLWSGSVLPSLAAYGKWVWADGAAYAVATYPASAANIGPQWRTFAGAADPGGSSFRVPDMRGLVVAGMDAMPGGSRANRMTRSIAIVIAGKTGEETHVVAVSEMPGHAHGVNDPGHGHAANDPGHVHSYWTETASVGNTSGYAYSGGGSDKQPGYAKTGYPGYYNAPPPDSGWGGVAEATGISINGAYAGVSLQNNGGGVGHENVQPTVFVPYIVKLDG